MVRRDGHGGAGGGIRTHKGLRPGAFKAPLSTSSSTPARPQTYALSRCGVGRLSPTRVRHGWRPTHPDQPHTVRSWPTMAHQT